MLRLLKVMTGAVACCVAAAALGQTPAEAPQNGGAVATPSSVLRPAISNVQAVTAGLNVRKWKASRGVRKATQEDVSSIQRDLGSTLPGLLSTADAAPGSVPPSFAVYRNLDALYDVLLRVSQTADLAASGDEARALGGALRQLESARSSLGQSILSMSQHHEAEIIALKSELRSAKTAPAANHRRETVIDDGPVRSKREVRHRRTVHRTEHKKAEKHKAAKPSPAKPAQPPASH